MAEKRDKKSASILSRTVKNIKRNRKVKNFIRIERKGNEEGEQKRGPKGKEEGEQKRRERKRRERRPKKWNKYGKGKKRAMIYVGHLPAGFYEYELKSYFEQFGEVTNVRLERSEKTGRSKGYAFVEFEVPEVAKIAAETMNNYLLFNRILKAEYVTRKYHRKHFWERKIITAENYPKQKNVQGMIRGSHKFVMTEKARLRKRITRLDEMIQRLKEKGIDYSYKPAIRREISDSPCADGKYVRLDTDLPVLEIDESDKEIEFMTPPNVIKKKLLVSKDQTPLLKKPNTKKQGKIKKKNRKKNSQNLLASANELKAKQKSTSVKQELNADEKTDIQIKKVTPEAKKINIKKQSPQFSQKLKSLSQGNRSKKQSKLRKDKKN